MKRKWEKSRKQFFFSELILGETKVGSDPDCSGGNCLAPIIKRSVSKIVVHEDFETGQVKPKHDIALIRVNEPIPLFSEDPRKSSVIPVCLPWKENDPGRGLKEGDQLVNTGMQRYR